MLFSDARKQFFLIKGSYCAAKTLSDYADALNRFEFFLDHYHQDIQNVEDITRNVMYEFLSFLRQQNIKNTSIHTYFRGINAFISLLIEEEIIEDFKYKIKLPRPDPALVMPLTVSEVQLCTQIISQTSEYWQRDLLIFRLMLDCGLRSQEVRQLLRCHINNDQIQIVNSKCNKNRVIPMPPVIKSLLDLYGYDRFSPEDPLFDIGDCVIKMFFQKLKKRSGIVRIHAHLLRHTFATSYMLHHNNLEYLRLYLGHESYNITCNYIHLASQCLLTHYDIYPISDVFM